MKDQNKLGPAWPATLFLSWFGCGKSPKAPGTIGSLGTLPLIYLLGYYQVNIIYIWLFIIILYTAAVLITQNIQQKFHLHDPQWIVIDEVIGMLITWSFAPSLQWKHLFACFLLFRVFDIIKVWPASYFDRLHHGIGTITDDVVSALYAGILYWLTVHFL